MTEQLPEFTSIGKVIALCERLDAIDGCYEQAVKEIASQWLRFRPELKAEVKKFLLDSRLAADSERLPPLTVVDTRSLELRVGWGEAELEYVKKRDAAMQRCKELGLGESGRPITVGQVTQIIDELLRLLNSKIQIDLSRVASAGAEFSESHRARLNERVTAEYRYLHDMLLRSFTANFELAGYACGLGNLGPGLVRHRAAEVEKYLDLFARGWCEIQLSLEQWTWGS